MTRQQPAPGEMILAITDGPIVSENITIDQRYAFQKEIATLKAERDRYKSALEEAIGMMSEAEMLIHCLEGQQACGDNTLDVRIDAWRTRRAALKGEKEPV